MIITLINIDSCVDSGTHYLAFELEESCPGLHVQCLTFDFVMDRLTHDRDALRMEREMDQALEMILDLSPQLVALYCTLWNMPGSLALTQRLHHLAPTLPIALAGPEAQAQSTQLRARQDISHVLEGPPLQALRQIVQQLSPTRASGSSTLGDEQSDKKHHQPQQRASAAGNSAPDLSWLASLGSPGRYVIVEQSWSGRTPLWLSRQLLPPPLHLSPDEAVARLAPLLRAGRRVMLCAPSITTQRDPLVFLLRKLAAIQRGTLTLELPAELLDDQLVALLIQAPLTQLEIDLLTLSQGVLAPEQLSPLIAQLQAAAICCRGHLVFGQPPQGHADFLAAIDRGFQAGLDELCAQRLLVPPQSSWRTQASMHQLVFSTIPPYESLGHQHAPFSDLIKSVRWSATYSLLQAELAGSGLLKAVGTVVGSSAMVVEEFTEHLVGQGYDPLRMSQIPQLGRQFFNFISELYNINLEQSHECGRFVRSPALTLRWLAHGQRLISDEQTGHTAHVGRQALSLLDRFDVARSGYDVCEELLREVAEEKRAHVRRALYQTLEKLVAMSLLVPLSAANDRQGQGTEHPFSCLEEFDYHYRMLADATRVDAYRRAIQQTIQPGQHVIEIGTGTGILAVLAAQAGARVTAIERFSVLGMAGAIARQSGVADRIHFIRGRSDLVELSERGDLLLSEIVGNRILNEGLLETTLDARNRLLKPQAGFIPCSLEILTELGYAARYDQVLIDLRKISTRYAVQLEPLACWLKERLLSGQVIWELGAQGLAEGDWQSLSPEISMVKLHLAQLQAPGFSCTTRTVAQQDGLINAVLLAFRLELRPGIEISTSGQRHDLHWSKPVFMLSHSLQVKQGQLLEIALTYEAHGEISAELCIIT